MKTLLCALLLSSSLLLAQDSAPATNPDSRNSKGQETLQGCVSRSNGDFVLMKQDPAVTYELQATHKIKLGQYLGQRVEVSGHESPSMSTSSDSSSRGGIPAVTLTVTSIRTIDKECTAHGTSAQ
jgi:hypothetical protein